MGLLCAFASKAAGAKAVVIADIQADRVKFAVDNGFADAGVTVPLPEKRPETIEEKLEYARGLAEKLKNAEIGGSAVGEVSATFECTGVESCMQTAIFVSFSSCFLSPFNVLESFSFFVTYGGGGKFGIRECMLT